MPIFSYLAYPKHGQKKALFDDLSALPYCEAKLADSAEILILVTDTPNEETERALQQQLTSLSSLQSLGMVFGHADA